MNTAGETTITKKLHQCKLNRGFHLIIENAITKCDSNFRVGSVEKKKTHLSLLYFQLDFPLSQFTSNFLILSTARLMMV